MPGDKEWIKAQSKTLLKILSDTTLDDTFRSGGAASAVVRLKRGEADYYYLRTTNGSAWAESAITDLYRRVASEISATQDYRTRAQALGIGQRGGEENSRTPRLHVPVFGAGV